MQTLCDLKENQKCVVVKIDENLSLPYKRRLYQLGIIYGTKMCVEKISPLKKSLLVSFESSKLTIQTKYAKFINVR